MSEEEKKAIDYLQLCYDLSTIDNKSLPKLATVLNLIEKQDKMIDLMAETMDLDIMYADEDKDIQTMKEKIKEKYRKKVEENDNS